MNSCHIRIGLLSIEVASVKFSQFVQLATKISYTVGVLKIYTQDLNVDTISMYTYFLHISSVDNVVAGCT